MYGFYLEEKRLQLVAGTPIAESFLVWHRTREYDSVKGTLEYRGGRHGQRGTPTLVVACRYWYELTDGYWGQFMLTQIPHQYARDLLPREIKHLLSMQNFVGMLEYLLLLAMGEGWYREGPWRHRICGEGLAISR